MEKKRKVLSQIEAAKKRVGSFYHPTKQTYRTGACPIGMDQRRGFDRKSYTKKDGTVVPKKHIKPKCIKDVGLPGKLLDTYKPIQLKVGAQLKPYGYSTKLKKADRHKCLLAAVNKLSYRTVSLRISSLRTLTKTTNPKVSKKFDTDLKSLQKWRKTHKDI
jgi:hypothetical protein